MDAVQQLEALAAQHEQIAKDARSHAEALRRLLGGSISVVKPKKFVSEATRQKLREKTRASWAKRKRERT